MTQPSSSSKIRIDTRDRMVSTAIRAIDPDDTIAKMYHNACRTPSDINEHLSTFVNLCAELNAQKVIELGTRGGVSTIAWLYGLEETDGHLWSIDIDPAPEFTHDRWTFIQGNDLDPKVIAHLPQDADIVFIDTSHEYQQTLAELNVYSWRVRPGGKIVLHDTELLRPFDCPNPRAQPPYPVKRAVTEWCLENDRDWSNRTNNNGLGVVDL